MVSLINEPEHWRSRATEARYPVLAVFLVLAGCASEETARCSYGAQPGTDTYVNCMVAMRQQNLQLDIERARGGR
jgi:hypothetical protein